MTDIERLEDRLTAVERTVIDGDHEFDDLDDLATLADAIDRIDQNLADLESRVADLEARSESIQGYITNVDSINEDVAKQAASAVAATESLQERVEKLEQKATQEENVDKYRPMAGSNGGSPTQLSDDGEIGETVDELVADTEREHTLGTPGQNGHSTAADGQQPLGTQNSNGSSDDEVSNADPQEVKARFDAQEPAQTDVETDSTGDDDDQDGGGFLASLKSALS